MCCSSKRKEQGHRLKEQQEGQGSRKGVSSGEDGGGQGQRVGHGRTSEFNSKGFLSLILKEMGEFWRILNSGML